MAARHRVDEESRAVPARPTRSESGPPTAAATRRSRKSDGTEILGDQSVPLARVTAGTERGSARTGLGKLAWRWPARTVLITGRF